MLIRHRLAVWLKPCTQPFVAGMVVRLNLKQAHCESLAADTMQPKKWLEGYYLSSFELATMISTPMERGR